MLFRNNLYFIDAAQRTEDGAVYTLRLNPDHVIYQAHFPGEPITPGVCILQIGQELLSDAVEAPLEMDGAKNVKFLSVLRPDGTPVTVQVRKIEIESETVKAQIEFKSVDTPVAKISLSCRKTAR